MGQFDRDLEEDITHWPATSDEFGGFTYATPVALKGRWEQKAVLFQNPEGVEEVSNIIVCVNADVAPGDYLLLGTSIVADPTSLADTWQVRQFHKTPNLRNLGHERKVFL